MALSRQRESPKEPGTGAVKKSRLSMFKEDKKLILCVIGVALIAIGIALYTANEKQFGDVQTARIKKPDGHIISIEWVSGIETPGIVHDPDCPVCRSKRTDEIKKGILQLFDSLQVQVTD